VRRLLSRRVRRDEEVDLKKKKKKKLRHKTVDQKEVKDAIRRTFAAMDEAAVSARAVLRKRKRKEREEEEERIREETLQQRGRSALPSSCPSMTWRTLWG